MVSTKSKKRSLLAIDPSASMRAVIARVCDECGIESDSCTGLAEARSRLAKGAFDLVITAAELPDGGPCDVLASVRGMEEMKLVPVLLLVARRSEHTLRDMLDKGITEVFFKHDLDDLARYLEDFAEGARGKKGNAAPSTALIVEDERALGLYLTKLLTRHGFEVDYVPSGAAALQEAERKRYDFVMVDIVLDGNCSGIQFLRHLRQPGMASASAVTIAMSAYDDEARRLEALRAGANVFMAKPIDEHELAAHIAGMARRPSLAKPKTSKSARPVDARQCTRCKPCELTPRESNICALVAAGYSDKRIAEEMAVSYWTVRTHIAHAFKKCQVSNRVELARRLRGD